MVPPDLATGFSQRGLHRSQPEPGGGLWPGKERDPNVFPEFLNVFDPLIHFDWFNMLLKLPWLLQPLLWLILVYAGQRTTSSILAD